MAYWQRRQNGRIFVYTHQNGKNKQVPRKQTKHLDGQSDANIQYWVDNWSRTYEKTKVQPDSINFQNSQLTSLVNQFIAFRAARGINHHMLVTHKNLLLDYALPFFLMQTPPLKDPNQWQGVSVRLLPYLESKQVPENSIKHLNTALRKFWAWLQEEGVVVTASKLFLRAPVTVKNHTPLKRVLTPDEVLEYAKARMGSSPKMALIALCGYFFSLRTLEVFGLLRKDFRAGKGATELEACKVMKALDLYHGFAVRIERQRSKEGVLGPPKTKLSVGWVSCFDKRAAELIVKLLINYKAEDLLIADFLPGTYMKHWREEGVPGVTIKDLRRASLYWLGHNTDFNPIQLRNHARHANLNTTLQYCRRPDEDVGDEDDSLTLVV